MQSLPRCLRMEAATENLRIGTLQGSMTVAFSPEASLGPHMFCLYPTKQPRCALFDSPVQQFTPVEEAYCLPQKHAKSCRVHCYEAHCGRDALVFAAQRNARKLWSASTTAGANVTVPQRPHACGDGHKFQTCATCCEKSVADVAKPAKVFERCNSALPADSGDGTGNGGGSGGSGSGGDDAAAQDDGDDTAFFSDNLAPRMEHARACAVRCLRLPGCVAFQLLGSDFSADGPECSLTTQCDTTPGGALGFPIGSWWVTRRLAKANSRGGIGGTALDMAAERATRLGYQRE